ncbi:MAG: DUF547 domain-containing protein [Ignavibacteria bacterium]|nr:DUF547 domain-containing protein [Ignavibacteria bacterium]
MKLLKVFLLLCFIQTIPAKDRHTLFTNLLKDNIVNGSIQYEQLKNDARLEKYLHYLGKTNPSKFQSKEEKIAFYINAYNAYTLKMLSENYQVESINDLHFGGLILGSVLKTTVWDKDFVKINNKTITLNYLRNEIIGYRFKDVRAIFVLFNGAKGSPDLLDEAYEGSKLNMQFNKQIKKFLCDKIKNKFDTKNKTAHLSELFDWYFNDFGGTNKKLFGFLSSYLEEKLKKQILKEANSWQIKYIPFDWDLKK